MYQANVASLDRPISISSKIALRTPIIATGLSLSICAGDHRPTTCFHPGVARRAFFIGESGPSKVLACSLKGRIFHKISSSSIGLATSIAAALCSGVIALMPLASLFRSSNVRGLSEGGVVGGASVPERIGGSGGIGVSSAISGVTLGAASNSSICFSSFSAWAFNTFTFAVCSASSAFSICSSKLDILSLSFSSLSAATCSTVLPLASIFDEIALSLSNSLASASVLLNGSISLSSV